MLNFYKINKSPAFQAKNVAVIGELCQKDIIPMVLNLGMPKMA